MENGYKKPIKFPIFAVLTLVFVTSGASFILGRISVLESTKSSDYQIISSGDISSRVLDGRESEQNNLFVASKNGRVYHFVWCKSAEDIKDSNKIFFGTKEEAQAKGYTPSKQCYGL